MKLIQKLLLTTVLQGMLVMASCQSDTTALSNQEFRTEAAAENVVILDVRTPEEYNSGFIPNARLINVMNTPQFLTEIEKLPRDKTYLVYCRSGQRSATAMQLMKQQGFAHVKHLKHGISGWDGEVVRP